MQVDLADQDMAEHAAIGRHRDQRQLGHEVRPGADRIDQLRLGGSGERCPVELVNLVEIDRLLRTDRPCGCVDRIVRRDGGHGPASAYGAPSPEQDCPV